MKSLLNLGLNNIFCIFLPLNSSFKGISISLISSCRSSVFDGKYPSSDKSSLGLDQVHDHQVTSKMLIHLGSMFAR
jgi:hypothetical protein